MTDLATNVLYYGDDHVTFRDESGNATDAQLLAFEDTWHSEAELEEARWSTPHHQPPGSLCSEGLEDHQHQDREQRPAASNQ
jgi:hypothetical protein